MTALLAPEAPTSASPAPSTPLAAAVALPTPIVLCDGGLANRLNALLFALILQEKFGHAWRIAWPLNNWCGAPLEALFEAPFPHDGTSLTQLRQHGRQRMLMQENQLDFPEERLVMHRTLSGYDDYRRLLETSPEGVVYFHNLVPAWVPEADVHRALQRLRPAADVLARADAFVQAQRIDRSVVGVHIRKTDFGGTVDDDALFAAVQRSPRRHFVCSDDAEVNRRFAALPNCAVFEKSHFPEKREKQAGWQHWTKDDDGRAFPFNIERGATAVVEGLVDLLILSRTELLPTSASTFLATARRLQAAGCFQQPLREAAPSQPPSTHRPAAGPTPMNDLAPATRPAVTPNAAVPMPAAPPAPQRPVTHADVFALLNLIRPWQIASDVKVRLGADGDGGYVMPSLSQRSNRVLSIGIGDEVSFDNQMADLGATVLQFDHTIPASPSRHERIHFHRVGWGARDQGPFLSLRSMMAMLDWNGARHPILKFDTEGAEWDCLTAATSEELARFDVMAGEFHDFQNLVNREYFDVAFGVFSKIAQTHHCVHMHANNAGGMVMIGGIPFPRLLELTFLRKDAAIFSGHSAEPIPGPLDRPNVRQLPEIHLRAF
jgi:hypothetical protein